MTASCARCGIKRQVNEGRKSTGLCQDCYLVERDLSRRGCGTPNGYRVHWRAKETICGPCLDAWRVHQEEQRRKRGIPPRKPSPCGTNGGYNRHWRAGEPTCPDCRRAHTLKESIRLGRQVAA